MKHRILHLIAVLLMIAANTTAQTITVSDYEAGAGWNETIKVNISDASEITAVQFNLSLPEGVVLDEGWLEQRGHQVFLGNAANGHSLAVKPLTSGDLLIVVYGLNLQTFNDGTLVEIMTMATDDVTTSNGRLYNVRTATVAAESKALSGVKFTAVVEEEEPEAKYYWYVGTTEPTELNGAVANAETDKWVEIGTDLSAVKYITIDTSEKPDYSFPSWYVLMPTSLGFKPHNSIGTKDESSAWDISDSSIEGYTLYVVDEGTLEAVFSTFKKEGSLPYDENADYWYLGQTDPSTRTEIYPIALQNWAIDDAWEEIVNSSEKIEVNKQPADWDFDSFTALWYVAMPASSGYTPQDADLWETSTATIAGKDYIVYKSEGKVWELNTAFLPEGYVEEEIAVLDIALDQTAATLTEGETLTLKATVSPDDATDKTVTWSTSDASVATVVDGVVTAVAAGTATITAKAGGKEVTCVVTVEAAAVEEPEGLIAGKNYRVKNVTTGLYMQVSGNNTNMKLQNRADGVELSQVFQLEDAGEGMYYIKAADLSNSYYAHASGWNFNATANAANKTPFTISLVEGEEGVYTLHQSVSNYKGLAGTDATEAGAAIYCNKGVDNNGKWSFEALTEEENAAYTATLTATARQAVEEAIARGEAVATNRSAVLTAEETAAINSAVQAAKEGKDAAADVTALKALSDAIHTAVDEAIYVWNTDALSNAMCYAVSTEDRGAWYAQASNLTSTAKAEAAVDVADSKQQFALVKSEKSGALYLYSVSEAKFVSAADGYTALTETPVQTVAFLNGTRSAQFPWVVALNAEDGQKQMGISNGYDPAVITHYNDLGDGGNTVRIEKAAAFDASATLAAIEALENPVITVTGITLSQTAATLTEGETLTLTATVAPDNATDKTVTWSSSNTAVATVDNNGVVTAVAEGTATITVMAGGKEATCVVTVEKKIISVTGITLNQNEATFIEGESLTLTATVAPEDATDKTVAWSSSNTAVATVDNNGVVTAVAEGTATITVMAGGKEATCVVTVEKKIISVTGITLNQNEATLTEGESLTLTATVAPDNATDKTVTWSSSDKSVATVDNNGKVTAVAAGTATITAKAGDKSATCVVTVKASVPDGIDQLTMDNGQWTIYDLTGRKVTSIENLKGGIYIVNGRKVLIK